MANITLDNLSGTNVPDVEQQRVMDLVNAWYFTLCAESLQLLIAGSRREDLLGVIIEHDNKANGSRASVMEREGFKKALKMLPLQGAEDAIRVAEGTDPAPHLRLVLILNRDEVSTGQLVIAGARITLPDIILEQERVQPDLFHRHRAPAQA
jgi:hypothetical protein